jgi:hypothetical protein
MTIKYIHKRVHPQLKAYNFKEFTVAYTTIGDKVYAGYAFCSLKDNYNKKVGREYALARLEQLIQGVPVDNFTTKVPVEMFGNDNAALTKMLVMIGAAKQ